MKAAHRHLDAPRAEREILTRVLASSITSMSIATSGPSTPRRAASSASPYTEASAFDGMSARHQRMT